MVDEKIPRNSAGPNLSQFYKPQVQERPLKAGSSFGEKCPGAKCCSAV